MCSSSEISTQKYLWPRPRGSVLDLGLSLASALAFWHRLTSLGFTWTNADARFAVDMFLPLYVCLW